MSINITTENIISFQSIEDFNEATGLCYDNLTEVELFEALVQWHYPGEHSTREFTLDELNTNFMGYQYINDKNYILSKYERGLIIGLKSLID